MRRYNVVMVFSPDGTKVLFCRRTKEPFLGKLNMVGGRIEPGESDEDAAYRELEEESGIRREDIELLHVMDFIYRTEDMELQVFAGQLLRETVLRAEENPLVWLDADENFFDYHRFAGNGNIGHILLQINAAGIPSRCEKQNKPEQ